MSVAAIVVAAGRGSRAGDGIPKQYRMLAGEPVLTRSLRACIGNSSVGTAVVVIHPDDRAFYDEAVQALPPADREKLMPPCFGGETRQDSVRSGLEALSDAAPELVLVHDAARPFVSAELVDRAIAAGLAAGAAIPGIPVTDTIKVVDAGGHVSGTPDRATLRAVQTPQAFRFDAILRAHRNAAATGHGPFTDDGALAEWAGLPVRVFAGDSANIKLTHMDDFNEADRRLRGEDMRLVTRVGTGFDVHAFADGDHVWLGGVRIPYRRGVLAHSDGDVILHALTDAVLGALADGDIGTHFPPSDPQWRGASSDRFLAHAVGLVRSRGGRVDHLDATLLCEAPRLGSHREAMRARIAEIAEIAVDQVSLKATTTEKMGFTGREEGLAAQAAATIRLPETTR
jgi:2-C-methyl-D-erythritol 4-phosphate cytidylyltransferase/2-C-methyl-D-erythritol 2,4-cyclodiphosphate synthase